MGDGIAVTNPLLRTLGYDSCPAIAADEPPWPVADATTFSGVPCPHLKGLTTT